MGSHYRIVRAIGDRGGFGKVFEVKDESRPERDFVMKVADGATPEERAVNEERLREEVKIAHRVTHQNTCVALAPWVSSGGDGVPVGGSTSPPRG